MMILFASFLLVAWCCMESFSLLHGVDGWPINFAARRRPPRGDGQLGAHVVGQPALEEVRGTRGDVSTGVDAPKACERAEGGREKASLLLLDWLIL